MPDITWIKVTTAMFEDEKLLIVESMPECDAILVMWTKLLLQAGKCNADGWIWLSEGKPYTDEMLAAIFRRPLNTVRLALETLQKLGMIKIDERGILIEHFIDHQNNDGLERVRELTRLRVQRFRENQIQTPVTLQRATVTGQNKTQNKKRLEQSKEEGAVPFSERIRGLERI